MLRVLFILVTLTPSKIVCVLASTLETGGKLVILDIGELGVACLIVVFDKVELSDTTGEITSGETTPFCKGELGVPGVPGLLGLLKKLTILILNSIND